MHSTKWLQGTLDTLLLDADRARVLHAMERGGSTADRCPLIELDVGVMPRLRQTLQLVPECEPLRCNCPGTLAIELYAGAKRLSVLKLHLHYRIQSLGLADADEEVRLADGSAFLNLLAQEGEDQPLVDFRSLGDEQRGGVPRSIVPLAAAPVLEAHARVDEMVDQWAKQAIEPDFDRAIAELRLAHQSERGLAILLLRRLGSHRAMPWREMQDHELLFRLNEDAVVAALAKTTDFAARLGAEQFLLSPEVLVSRGSLLAKVPDSTWEDLLDAKGARGTSPLQMRLAHARDVSHLHRQRRSRATAVENGQLVAMGTCRQGTLRGLVTDGAALYSLTDKELIRILPHRPGDFFDARPWAVWRERATELLCTGPHLLVARQRGGVIGEVAPGQADRAVRVRQCCPKRRSPRHLAVCNGLPAWIESLAPDAAATSGSDSTAGCVLARLGSTQDVTRTTLITGEVLGMVGDRMSLYWIEHSGRETLLMSLAFVHELPSGLARLEPPAQGACPPLLALTQTHILYSQGTGVHWVSKRSRCITATMQAPRPIAALAASGIGTYILMGARDDSTWQVAYAAADEKDFKPIASFQRTAAENVAAVTIGDILYFVCGDRLYGVEPQ